MPITRNTGFNRASHLPVYVNPLLGHNAGSTNGAVDPTPRFDDSGRLEAHTPYDAVNGSTFGMRTCAWRVYGDWGDVVAAAPAADGGSSRSLIRTGSKAYNALASGHVLIYSFTTRQSGLTTAQLATKSLWAWIRDGYFDPGLRALYNDVEAFDWGGNVDPALAVWGAAWGGTKPSECWLLLCNEININTPSGATAAEAAGALKHMMELYDSMSFTNGKHIYFSHGLSRGDDATIRSYFDYLGTHDITGFGTRAVDGFTFDFYYPSSEVNNIIATSNNESPFLSNHFAQAETLAATYLPDNSPSLICETACRLPTDGTTPDGADPGWPAKWWKNGTYTAGGTTWDGVRKYAADHKMLNGGSALRIICQFQFKDGATVNDACDNTIAPGFTSSAQTGWQHAGISTRPSFVAYHDVLVDWGNPFMPGSTQDGHTPTGVYADTPALGSLTTTLHWTPTAGEVIKVYKDGGLTQTLVAGTTSAVIRATGSTLPQTHAWTVTGVGTNSVESAQSSPPTSVTFNPVAGVVPSVPTGLGVAPAGIGTGTAVVTCSANPAGENVTGYEWAVDGDLVNRYETAGVSVTVGQGTNSGGHIFTALSSDADHTVQVRAVNVFGPSSWSAAQSFHTAALGDSTPPTVPGAPLLAGTVTVSAVPLSWTAVTDQVVPGSVTSGLSNYLLGRSASNNLAGAQPSAADILLTPVGTSVTDVNPPSSVLVPTDVWYFVAAKDNVGNVSNYGPGLQVTIPTRSLPTGPTAVLAQTPTGRLTAGGSAIFSLTGSVAGTAGPIVGYRYDFGDGDVFDFDGSLQRPHTFLAAGQYIVQGSVKDSTGNVSDPAILTVIVDPTGGPTTRFAKIPYAIKGADMLAADVNNPFDIVDLFLESEAATSDTLTTALVTVGNPLSARRYGGADFVSLDPPSATSEMILAAATGYVLRVPLRPNALFVTARWIQTAVSPSAVTGAMWAVYDVNGQLVSLPGLDSSSQWSQAGPVECSVTIPGGAFDLPIGGDDPANPSYQCFVYFYLGTVGGTPPRMAAGASSGAGNIGTTSPITPTQASIDSVPLFSTCAHAPGGALQPPATLGVLTKLAASPLVVLL